MTQKTALVVTSISSPNAILKTLAKGCQEHNWDFILIGDKASPLDFYIEGCDYYDLDRQTETGFQFARQCPVKHYARKNIGYLVAIKAGADVIVETDDDNIPLDPFWEQRKQTFKVHLLENTKWVNIYRYYTDQNIWPRGLALDAVLKDVPDTSLIPGVQAECYIQQNLADENPDVDAIYRLTLPLPLNFSTGKPVAIGQGAWCPFNSQNTTWWPQAFGLMYLPYYCSFRMTDIWRSFVAQRIAAVNQWPVLFDKPTVRQERNDHNLMRDFEDEIPGYLNNDAIMNALEKLQLKAGIEQIPDNLKQCYETLIRMELVGPDELPLIDAWFADLNQL